MDSDDGYGFEDEVDGSEEEEDELDLADQEHLTRQASRPTEDFRYECLTPEIIAKTMIESIEEVNGIFQVTPRCATRQLPWGGVTVRTA